mmetsp:Transcript_30057/g.48930  ORF Transcript_30057/g.48930 Transcript_30057/m.48930 type:complete len:454 (+) Transcript_30057:1820-3181(+)
MSSTPRRNLDSPADLEEEASNANKKNTTDFVVEKAISPIKNWKGPARLSITVTPDNGSSKPTTGNAHHNLGCLSSRRAKSPRTIFSPSPRNRNDMKIRPMSHQIYDDLKNEGDNMHLFLFNDLLIQARKMNSGEKYLLLRWIPIDNIQEVIHPGLIAESRWQRRKYFESLCGFGFNEDSIYDAEDQEWRKALQKDTPTKRRKNVLSTEMNLELKSVGPVLVENNSLCEGPNMTGYTHYFPRRRKNIRIHSSADLSNTSKLCLGENFSEFKLQRCLSCPSFLCRKGKDDNGSKLRLKATEATHFLVVLDDNKFFFIGTSDIKEKAQWMAALISCIDERRKTIQGQKQRLRKRALQRNMSSENAGENDDSLIYRMWQADGATNNCNLCYRAFTFFWRRHHCRHCGLLVCDMCSLHRRLLPGTDTFGLVSENGNISAMRRVCNSCVKIVDKRYFKQ